MATTTEDQPVRRSDSDSYNGGNQAPYLRLVKTQLNFFMTRMLFMQEAQADSLGAQKSRMQNSVGSLNNSASRDMTQANASATGDGLKKYFDEDQQQETREEDELWVYNDNARVLPNSRAKSYPPIPAIPAAPESPRQVERKDGVRIMMPTHQPTDPMARKPAAEDLPLNDMTLDEGETSPPEEIPPVASASEEDEEMVMTTDDDEEGKARKAMSPVPRGPRVFPKNQRRSKRFSSRERPQRSQSFGRHSESSGDDDRSTGLNSSSLH